MKLNGGSWEGAEYLLLHSVECDTAVTIVLKRVVRGSGEMPTSREKSRIKNCITER